ncbi:hypothetical protein B296_00043920 [Ensete ventricosum]|uniref:ZF-HD dimerization-type domain-containing protein n=1 Tax=Ensete ventricosum TaxID=4639 RepID=A0A426Z2E2_ENSVE|nr:hypothetical protein B296_00043920 [Ensete ventricosum]
MDFDDHDEADEEIGLLAISGYDTAMPNSARGGGGDEMGGSAGGAEEAAVPGSGKRKVGGGGWGVRYRECLKNHAVAVGGQAVDGCSEFLAGGEEGTLDAHRCAGCSCHRNFHRREAEGGGGGAVLETVGYYHQFSPFYGTPAITWWWPRPHSSSTGRSSSRGSDSNPMMGGGGMGTSGSGGQRKRFRTRFTQEQKDKMLAFAESVGWRIQKHDEAAVQQFCDETCVKRHALKVWMHNNKHNPR